MSDDGGRGGGEGEKMAAAVADGGAGALKGMVRTAEMPEDMKKSALAVAEEAVKHEKAEKDIAAYVKKKFDELHGPTWHCIVGRNYGSWVSHENQRFVYLYCGKVAILLFKSA